MFLKIVTSNGDRLGPGTSSLERDAKAELTEKTPPESNFHRQLSSTFERLILSM
jgi:hypothetical protein